MFKDNWREFLKARYAYSQIVITLTLLIPVVYLLSRFIIFVESRNGSVLYDPFFNFFEAVELNIPIFALIYLSILACLIHLAKHPQNLMIALESYTLIVLVRMLAMYSIPLEPPPGTIDLQDPLVFVVGTGTKITKDLFFSGHTSTLFLLFLVSVDKKIKYIFLINTFLVGLFVILQKAHYTVDVIAAPFFSYGCYKIILNVRNLIFKKLG